jgi:hypothetical protein
VGARSRRRCRLHGRLLRGAGRLSALRRFCLGRRCLSNCEDLRITTERDNDQQQRAVTIELRSGKRAWVFTGSVDNAIPLRHRRPGTAAVTRIVEGFTTWTSEDGALLHGMTEYLDQIVDGAPVGLAV